MRRGSTDDTPTETTMQPTYTQSETRTALRRFIADDLLMGQAPPFADDALLLEEGIIDSLALLEIVSFIEETYDLVVDDADVTLDAFGSIESLAAYVASRLPSS